MTEPLNLHDAFYLARAYVALLRLRPEGAARTRLQGALAALRDEIARQSDAPPQRIQEMFEHIVAVTNDEKIAEAIRKIFH